MKIASILFTLFAVIVVGFVGYKVWQRGQQAPVLETDQGTQQDVLDSINSSPTPSPMSDNSSQIVPITHTVHVVLKTSKGDMTMDLDGARAPLAVGNFVTLAKAHFYDGVSFHRVIPNFMIQTGDPLSKDPAKRAQHGTGGPGYTFKTELPDAPFVRGAVGMARTAQLDTNGSQFFIMVADMHSLDGQYTNFGTVTAGLDVADAIVSVPRDDNDNPLEPITITSVTVSE